MFSALLPDGDAIDRWADDVSAPALVPLLVRKLISQTTDPTWIDVPAGTATRYAGWDGEVDVPTGNTWVPDGRSLWEIGTNDRITTKANEDYDKRTTETPESERKNATFVFVSPRSWGYRKTWLKAKRKLGDWHDVRAIDAEGLASWAETVPYVHIWLSHQINGRASGAEPLDMWWDAPVLVDAEHGNPGAAVGLAAPAGDTLAARQIWNDHTGLTDRDIALAGNLNDLDGKLMSHDTGIVEEWMRAFVDVVVSAAKAYPARTNQRLTARRGGRGKPGNVQLTWLRTDQRLNEHGDSRNRG